MIRVGIVGYGNLGRGVSLAINEAEDMDLVAIFTRRDPSVVQEGNVPFVKLDNVKEYQDKIDVMILCGGSATDLPIQTVELAKYFHVVDSFDTHAKIPEHYAAVDASAKMSNHIALISTGWDPGLFSLMRLFFQAILPNGKEYTFWGKGVSQGHSDAIRRIDGVKDAIQYTIPKEEALELVRSGKNPELSVRDKHLRECFVVVEEDADQKIVEKEIKEMPNYFDQYDTIVHFISEEELKKNHKGMPHGGFVIRTGSTNEVHKHKMEFSLELDSNPEFTASVLVAYARAIYALAKNNEYGCKTVFDIAPKYLLQETDEAQRKYLL
ncbi:MAG: diaminopimelate dehydrogenase [Solobacterium sp.]|nr:diaminopimelate dehydrogenase [Solobacterium sp.]